MNTKKWKMKTGEEIRIKDMADSHLVNTIKMLERNSHRKVAEGLELGFLMGEMLQGEMALLEVENEIEQLSQPNANVEYLPPIYWDMIEETERRKIALHK